MAKKKSTPVQNWLDDAEEVPRRKSLSNRDRYRRQVLYRWVVKSSVFLTPALAILCILLLGNAGGKNDQVVAKPASVDVKGRTTATLEVQQWLASTPSPVAGKGQIVSYDGQTVVKKPAPLVDKNDKETVVAAAYTTELQHFTISDGLGQTYSVDVTVASDKTYGATVIAGPSLLPVPGADKNSIDQQTSAASGTWPGLYDDEASSSVKQAVDTWAKAFTQGDSAAMRLAMQDKKEAHTYQTLSNVQAVIPQVGAAAFDFGSTEANAASQGKKTSKQLVRVTLYIQWKGNPAPTGNDDTKGLPAVTYDVLITNANSAAPAVVAWGSPGTGTKLQPYQNALVGKKLQPAPTEAPTAPAGGDGATVGN
ncbi:hypothetical protein ACWGJ9_09255 [Curtobacterium citreum]